MLGQFIRNRLAGVTRGGHGSGWPFPGAYLVLLLLSVVPLVGGAVYLFQKERFEAAAHSELGAIAELKAGQISDWLRERERDVRALAVDNALIGDVREFARSGSVLARARIAWRFEALGGLYGYASVLLVDPDGRVLLNISGTPPEGSRMTRWQALMEAGRVGRSELYLDADGEVWMDHLAPVFSDTSPLALRGPVAAIVLRTRASWFLFPLIQRWPTRSPSGETLLVRRDGDRVLYLNELRQQPGTALRLRTDLDARRPAAMALLRGGRGVFETSDYRDVPVLVAHQPVAETDWQLVAKVDRDEVYAPLHLLVLGLSLVTLTALLLMGLLFSLLWRQRRRTSALEEAARSAGRDRLLALVFDQPFTGVAIGTVDGRWLHVNDRLCRMLGTTREELLAAPWIGWVHEADREACTRYSAGLFSGQVPGFGVELRLLRQDGALIWARFSAKCVRDADRRIDPVVSLFDDITVQRVVQTALAESERRFRNLIESTSDWIWEVDAAGHYIYVSPQVSELLGYAPEEVLGKTPFDFMPLGEGVRVREAFRTLAGECKAFQGMRNVNLHRNGQSLVLETSGVPVLDAEGRLRGYRGIDRDVTRQVAVEEALRASEQKYRALVECAAEMVLLLDPSGELLEINAAGERLLGARREALLGRNVRDFLAPGDGPRIDAVFALLASDGYAEYLDGHALTRQTELVPVDIRFSSVEVGGSRLVQGVVHDLSAQRLRESQRLREEAALRDALVREVHHRIKNSLQGITGFLRSLARHHVALAPALDEVVGQVRSIAIVHGLYARRSGARVMLCDLVSDIAHNIESLWRTELTIDMPAEGLPFCVAEEETVPLALVLNELLANAVKHRGAAAPPEIRVGPCGPVGEVCVCIVNRGRLPAGFDFARGHALGTGLSLVARLLPRHGAELAWREGAEESPGEDTVTVSLTLSAPVLVDVACLEEQGNG